MGLQIPKKTSAGFGNPAQRVFSAFFSWIAPIRLTTTGGKKHCILKEKKGYDYKMYGIG